MRRFVMLFAIFMFCAVASKAQNFIPLPVKVESGSGSFRMPDLLEINYSPEVKPLAGYLEHELKKIYFFYSVKKTERRGEPETFSGTVGLYIDSYEEIPAEGYILDVSPDGIIITSKDYGGVFNGIQTLLQMLPLSPVFSGVSRDLTEIHITDYPRLAYRGMMLDVARTFVPKETVKKYIDNLSRHKINKFHWHIADDEGWRIEIKSRPELAETGGYRGGESPIPPVYGNWDSKYGGYYTQDEIREIVEFAAVRNVEIIPEIDLPGHSRTVARVYPEILCAGAGNHASTNGMDMRNVWCVAREENYAVLDDIVREIAGLFPSEYIHIGGDEVEYGQWGSCPDCKALMSRNGLTDKKQLHHHFVIRLESILARYGKSAAVWNEAIEGGRLDENTRVHGWEGVEQCRNAAGTGYKTVVMPSSFFYFDMKYSADEPGASWAGFIQTEKLYSFDFVKEGFSGSAMNNVIGVEGALWHEMGLANGSWYVDYQSYPRICALSEIAWTPQKQRQWDDFDKRMKNTHFERLRNMGISYRTEPKPSLKPKNIAPPVSVESSLTARKSNPFSVLRSYRHGSIAKTTRGARKGDYILYRFDKPVDCVSIEIITGYAALPRGVFSAGYAEVKYKGSEEFVRYGDLLAGKITIFPLSPVVAVRVVCTAQPIGDSYAVFLPLRIVGK